MQQEEDSANFSSDSQQMTSATPQAQCCQGDLKLQTDLSILNGTILDAAVGTDTALEFDETSYSNYLLSLMQGEEFGMNALNWVVGTPAPIHRPISPAQANAPQRQRATVFATPVQNHMQKSPVKHSSETTCRALDKILFDSVEIDQRGSLYRKPNCSYTCLIGMALGASKNGCLPVNEIYKFIEREYPFFRTAPEGWKNSVRHSLSLNQCFRKVERVDGWQGKKGYFWELNPDRKISVQKEIDKWLKEEGRQLVENPNGLEAPFTDAFPASLQARVPVMPAFLQSPHARSSVTSARGLAGQLHTPQQVAQLQHFAQELQQECAERMALFQTTAPSSVDLSLSDLNKTSDGSSSSSCGTGDMSCALLNVNEPPSQYACSVEEPNEKVEDLSSSMLSGFDFNDFDEGDSTFHSFILSDDITFQSDANQVVATSPAVEVEVATLSSEDEDSSFSMIGGCATLSDTEPPGSDKREVVELSHNHMTSTPVTIDDQKDAYDQSQPCSSKTVLALKTDKLHRPCMCRKLFSNNQQCGRNELCAHLKLKKTLRKRLQHPRHMSGLLPSALKTSKDGGPLDSIISGEMAATGEQMGVMPSWKQFESQMKISITLNKLETESEDSLNSDKNTAARRYSPISLSDVFQSPSKQALYWNDSTIISPTIEGITDEEMVELQQDLFDSSSPIDSTKPIRTEDHQDTENIQPKEGTDSSAKVSGFSCTIDSTCEGFDSKCILDCNAKDIKMVVGELQMEPAACNQVEKPAADEASL